MSNLGRIGTCISLDIETKSMFNDLKMQGVNMSESIREHIRWLYASRVGSNTKTWVEHHWEVLQDDRREYEDALGRIIQQQDRFISNLPRNIAMHEKSISQLTIQENNRIGCLKSVKNYVELKNQKYLNQKDETKLLNKEYGLIEMVENWNELSHGPIIDIRTEEGLEKILDELQILERKRFIQKASVDQIEIKLESEGNIPDLIAMSTTNMMLPSGDEL
jgi:hypothetical protein